MSAHPPLFRFQTYPSDALRVSSGANMGDGIGLEDDALPGDIYRLARHLSEEGPNETG